MLTSVIEELLIDDSYAAKVIAAYCNWANIPNPLGVDYNNEKYARTKDVTNMISKKIRFIQQRSNHDYFYQQLGSLRFVDTSERANILRDYRLLVTWLHNPSSVAMTLLCEQPTFNAFVNHYRFGAAIAPRYSISAMEQLYGVILTIQEDKRLVAA